MIRGYSVPVCLLWLVGWLVIWHFSSSVCCWLEFPVLIFHFFLYIGRSFWWNFLLQINSETKTHSKSIQQNWNENLKFRTTKKRSINFIWKGCNQPNLFVDLSPTFLLFCLFNTTTSIDLYFNNISDSSNTYNTQTK